MPHGGGKLKGGQKSRVRRRLPRFQEVYRRRLHMFAIPVVRVNGECRLSGLTYVLHFLEQRALPADDRGGPIHYGDDLNPRHPFAGR
mgnify:CR=1 FL=1